MTTCRFFSWKSTVAAVALLAILLAGTWWAYHPGLTGGFQFDDFANLPAIGASGPVDNWATFWRYITSGHADPTGRPITMLTFLLDARTWPANPEPFLRTSIELHLVNGVLLFVLLRQLGLAFARSRDTDPAARDARHASRRRIDLAALLGTAFWLLHPFLVSTTLYIVQREAMLPATFVMIGLLAWLHGRSRLLGGQTASGWAWMLLGLGVCTVLAVLSKANGILLPALALTIEYTLLARPDGGPAARRYRWALRVLGWLPALIVAVYLLHRGWDGFVHGTGRRPWTMGQRLLTEPRVLMDYLQLLWLPRPFTPGLFNDQIRASTSLLHPWTTLPCLVAVVGLIVAALKQHRRWPAWALAVLFYFVGQSIESSTVALELYFEHRNYLPSLLMFWPLALWLCGVPQRRPWSGVSHPSHNRWLKALRTGKPTSPALINVGKAVFAVLVIVSLGTMTHARAAVWGNTHEQALLWAHLNPDSPRAQANAAMAQMHAGQPALAIPSLRKLLKQDPSQVQLSLNLFGAECNLGHVSATTLQAAKVSLATTGDPGAMLEHWFARAIAQTSHPPCPQMSLPTIEALLAATRSNTKLMAITGRRQDTLYLQGLVALKKHQPDTALTYFKKALAQDTKISAALEEAANLGSRGYPNQGLALLQYYEADASKHDAKPGFGMPMVHAWVLKREQYWQNQLAYLRHTLRSDAAAGPQKGRG
ncbi:MAG TPA: tetratricopeptide repeat protein [Rhodanobacteraceae bacterium]